MDYLGRQRYIPRASELKAVDPQTEVDQKLCQSCRHYEFYYCKALEQETAPLKACMAPEMYLSKLGGSHEKATDSNVAIEP